MARLLLVVGLATTLFALLAPSVAAAPPCEEWRTPAIDLGAPELLTFDRPAYVVVGNPSNNNRPDLLGARIDFVDADGGLLQPRA